MSLNGHVHLKMCTEIVISGTWGTSGACPEYPYTYYEIGPLTDPSQLSTRDNCTICPSCTCNLCPTNFKVLDKEKIKP